MPKASSVSPWTPPCVSIYVGNAEENGYFEWFKCQTAKKIPGAFGLTFWNKLLFQATLNEPAVLHAVLTLSSVHKRGALRGNGQSRSDDTPDEQEQFMLRHYIKAIRHLQPHFSTKDKASVRVALITCVVFIWLDLLRGHFKTAQTHLQNGLNVLKEFQIPSSVDDGILLLKPLRNSVDGGIVEAFFRLVVQVELFKHTYQHPCLVLRASGPEPSIPFFHSVNEAWQQMERLFSKVFHLTEQGRQQQLSNSSSIRYPPALLGYQQNIQAELAQWLDTYEASRKDMQGQDSEGIVRRLLRNYHTLASIMANACLCIDDESIFDSYTEQFVFLINQSADMSRIRRMSGSWIRPLPGHYNMSRSMVDVGWIPPLYYTALKCRIHRVRLQAIRLLETSSHREGIWDSRIAACVARKVMEIEERDFYVDVDTADDFLPTSSPGLRDLSLPTLPHSYRIREVKVVLPNGPMDSVFLSYRQKQTSEAKDTPYYDRLASPDPSSGYVQMHLDAPGGF